ncbi:MAG TPA: hypothetical protein VGF16_08445 [Bryobacteraceae bacterium]
MKREEIDKLLGGYATGTLTPEEREALFAAALDDQHLFDALCREEPLRELLQDPVVKARLTAGLERTPAPWYRRWLRPAAWAIPVAAMAAVVVSLIVERRASQQPITIAEVRQLRREAPTPVPSPLPQSLEKRELPAVGQVSDLQKDLALPAPPRLAKEPPTETAAPTAAPLAATPPPPPPPAPATPPPAPTSAAEQVQVAGTFGLTTQQGQQGNAGLRVQPAGGLVGGVGGQASQDARALFFGAPGPVLQLNAVDTERKREARAARTQLMRAPAPATMLLGLRYRLLRRPANGELTAVSPNEPIEGAGELILRLEANDSGYLSVFEHTPDGSWQQLSSRATQRLAPYDVAVDEGSGTKELFVVLTRQPQATAYPVPEARLDEVQTFNPAEQATYVVSTQTPILAFPITLRHK